MNRELVGQLHNKFNQLAHRLEKVDIDFWYARELMQGLGYERWENFSKVIDKAIIACQNTKVNPDNHFRDVTKMVEVGSGAERPVDDIMLTRYACYLIAQNGDPRKQEIAFAQSYFALQTRRQELVEERLHLQERLEAREKLRKSETELSKNIYERGVDDQGFGRIRSKGDAVLFGGSNTSTMKKKLKVSQNRPLADFLPTVTLAAKNLATEITNHNVNEKELYGERKITTEHMQNNQSVRSILQERGITPEHLPAEKDLKKLEKSVKATEKKLIKESELP